MVPNVGESMVPNVGPMLAQIQKVRETVTS